MRVDVVTIFPDYLAPLDLSLAGKAREKGLLRLEVHDLRHWTHDRHRTVDDTPYGGGAGMVMRPEPWGEALDSLGVDDATLVVPTPSGRVMDQALARELAGREHLVFACGRYEGIDQRVLDHYAGRTEVVEVSLGDFVLNGGEVAAMAVIEAVARLLPGFMGNAESLVEESHEDGLLEYPVYTRPAGWRGLEVPEVLLSGDHGRIAAWRHEQRVRRTVERRPDLLPAAPGAGDLRVAVATPGEAGELLTLLRAGAPPAAGGSSTLDQVAGWWAGHVVASARRGGRMVAAGRARTSPGPEGEEWLVDRVVGVPDLPHDPALLELVDHLVALAPPGCGAVRVHLPADHQGVRGWARERGLRPWRGEAPEATRVLARPISR